MKLIKRALCFIGIHDMRTIAEWSHTDCGRGANSGWFVNECSKCGTRRRWFTGPMPPIPDQPNKSRKSEGRTNSNDSYQVLNGDDSFMKSAIWRRGSPQFDGDLPLEINELWYCGKWYLHKSKEWPVEDEAMFDPFECDMWGRGEDSGLIDGLIPAYKKEGWVGLYKIARWIPPSSPFYDGAPWDDGKKVDLKLVKVIPESELELHTFFRPEALAERFHNYYEKLAPKYSYKTRDDSAVPWDDVPRDNKRLMIATCEQIAGDYKAILDKCNGADDG